MSLPDQLIGRPETQEQLRKLAALSSEVEIVRRRGGARKGQELEFYFTDFFIRDLLNFSSSSRRSQGQSGLE